MYHSWYIIHVYFFLHSLECLSYSTDKANNVPVRFIVCPVKCWNGIWTNYTTKNINQNSYIDSLSPLDPLSSFQNNVLCPLVSCHMSFCLIICIYIHQMCLLPWLSQCSKTPKHSTRHGVSNYGRHPLSVIDSSPALTTQCPFVVTLENFTIWRKEMSFSSLLTIFMFVFNVLKASTLKSEV